MQTIFISNNNFMHNNLRGYTECYLFKENSLSVTVTFASILQTISVRMYEGEESF